MHCDPPSGAPQAISDRPGRNPFAGPDFLPCDRAVQLIRRQPAADGPDDTKSITVIHTGDRVSRLFNKEL